MCTPVCVQRDGARRRAGRDVGRKRKERRDRGPACAPRRVCVCASACVCLSYSAEAQIDLLVQEGARAAAEGLHESLVQISSLTPAPTQDDQSIFALGILPTSAQGAAAAKAEIPEQRTEVEGKGWKRGEKVGKSDKKGKGEEAGLGADFGSLDSTFVRAHSSPGELGAIAIAHMRTHRAREQY